MSEYTHHDPLNEALREATLAVLLGSTEVQHQTVTTDGYPSIGTVTIESAFVQRIRSKAHDGVFDDLLKQAMEKISVENVARALEGLLAEKFVAGLKSDRSWGANRDGWFENRAQNIAIAACTAALQDDEALMDTLRTRIGMEVDRNRVNLTVQLSEPET